MHGGVLPSNSKRQVLQWRVGQRVILELVLCSILILTGIRAYVFWKAPADVAASLDVAASPDIAEVVKTTVQIVQPAEDPDLLALRTAAQRWLRPWNGMSHGEGGITEAKVSKVYEFLQRGPGIGSLRIQVIDGVLQEPIVVKEWLETKIYYPPRIEHWMKLFRHIEKTHGLPDYLDLVVSTEDQVCLPKSFQHIQGPPIFTYASTSGYFDIPMPTMEYFGNKLAEIDLELAKAQQWDDRIGAPALWRGSPTGGEFTVDNYQQKQRYQLVNASKHYPDLIDARMLPCAPGQCTSEAWALMEQELPTGGNQFSYNDYINHKFLIDIDGNAWSSRFILLLSTGCVIFKIETPYVEYFNEFLIPYKHYIPVASDSSDLHEKIQYAIAHDDEMRAISENLLATFNRVIANGRWEYYVSALLHEYSKLLVKPTNVKPTKVAKQENKNGTRKVGNAF